MAAITDLTSLVAADVATGDYLPIHDASAGTDKKITRSEFFGPSGTWTPTLTCGTSGTITLGGATFGKYAIVGPLVFVTAFMVVGSVSSPAGDLYIPSGSLPKVPTSNKQFSGSVYAYGLDSSTTTALQVYVYNNIYIRRFTAGSEATDVAGKVSAGDELTVTCVYMWE